MTTSRQSAGDGKVRIYGTLQLSETRMAKWRGWILGTGFVGPVSYKFQSLFATSSE